MDVNDEPETTSTDVLIIIVRCGHKRMEKQFEARLVRRRLFNAVTTCFGGLKVPQTCPKWGPEATWMHTTNVKSLA